MTTVEMLRSVARGAGVAVALIGAGVLIGWTFDIPLCACDRQRLHISTFGTNALPPRNIFRK